MDFAAPAQDAAPDVISEVTVAVLGDTFPPAIDLREALIGLAPGTSWAVVTGTSTTLVDIALCDSVGTVAAAAARWPSAGIIAIVDPAEDGSAVVAALQASGDVCMRRADARLAAAYVHSVARNRELTADSAAQR